jgi:Carbohydrate family 9 binding domain-like
VLRAVVAGVWIVGCACRFTVDGVGDDAAAPGADLASSGADQGAPDFAPAPDLADPCGTVASPDPSAAPAACVIGTPPVIDGDLADWPAARFTQTVTHASAGTYQAGAWTGSFSTDDADCSAEFALAWDASFLYVAVRAFDQTRASPPTPNDWEVDSLELYVDGLHDRTDAYGADDHHFILRTDGTGHDYDTSGAGHALPADLVRAVGAGDGVRADWSLEAAIPWSLLGGAAPAAGRVLGFDVQMNDDDNPIRAGDTHWLIWRVATTTCDCWSPASTCYPACNTKAFAALQLQGR